MQVNALNKITFQYIEDISEGCVSNGNWLINPDMSSVSGSDKSLWIIEGITVRLKTQAETDAEAQAQLDVQKASLLHQIYHSYERCEIENLTPAGAIQLAEWCGEENIKALAVKQWIVDLYDERDAKLALVEAGDLTIDPTPSAPTKPYTFREMKVV